MTSQPIAPAQSPTAAQPIAGQIVAGQVKLIKQIGRGSRSTVYVGVTKTGQAAAVKIFPPFLKEYALREYQYTRQLNHPRLAPVKLMASLGDCPALVCVYARGTTLFQRYAQKPALTHERDSYLRTLSHLLEALEFFHTSGLVHRDIKPDNIMVETDGTAKLVDYDLSGPILEDLGVPTRIGTQAFQSPEATRGEPQGPESDLYSVGILLHWGLFGQLPNLEDDEEDDDVLPNLDDPLIPLLQELTEPDREKRLGKAGKAREKLHELGMFDPSPVAFAAQ